MSNLDTTLREKFYSWASDYDGTKSTYDADTVIDFFLAEFHQLMNEKREAIEELAPYSLKMPDNGALIGRTHDLVRLHDVLSILKD